MSKGSEKRAQVAGNPARISSLIDDPDVAERMRQFAVVCKIALETRAGGLQGGRGLRRDERFKDQETLSIERIGQRDFGLSKQQSRVCLSRAKDYLTDARDSFPQSVAAEGGIQFHFKISSRINSVPRTFLYSFRPTLALF
jgi:hypothetical protein